MAKLVSLSLQSCYCCYPHSVGCCECYCLCNAVTDVSPTPQDAVTFFLGGGGKTVTAVSPTLYGAVSVTLFAKLLLLLPSLCRML